MAVLLGAVLTVLCVVVLALPFLRRGRGALPAPADWGAARQPLYRELRLLEQERELGHLSGADYEQRAEEIRLQAAALVRAEAEAALQREQSAPRGRGRRGPTRAKQH